MSDLSRGYMQSIQQTWQCNVKLWSLCTFGFEVCRYLRPLAIWVIHSIACS